MWQMDPRLTNRVWKVLVQCLIFSSYPVEMTYSLRKDLKPASTPELAEYSDMSTEAAMPKRQAGARSERYFMASFATWS